MVTLIQRLIDANRFMKLADLIIFEDDDFIALNKPSGLLSIPDREGKEISLKSLLQEKYEHIFTVHGLTGTPAE